jgi:hypothetical protein
MSFRDRTGKEQAFLNQLRPALEGLGIRIAPNGTEYTHGDFMDALRQSADPTALALRFQPDIICYLKTEPGRPFYVEAKAADTIERNAYEQYRRLAGLGHIIVVVFEPFGAWKWNFVEDILLRHERVHNGKRFALGIRRPVAHHIGKCCRAACVRGLTS